MTPSARRSGILIPLFSAPSSASWGIGDIGDIAHLSRWLHDAGQRILQLLPLNEMAPGTQSPYSAMSAMAIDPIFIQVSGVDEFTAAGGEAALTSDDRAALDEARRSRRVEYGLVRPVKERALRYAFEQFLAAEWRSASPRAEALQRYIDAEGWWLSDYALFRALHDQHGGCAWTDWPDAVRSREPHALASARAQLETSVLFYQYLQWIAGEQWATARRAARGHGVELFGDLPFMVDLHSADVWMHQSQFHLDRSIGVPPDAFSATGQDWGMPPYNWEALAAHDFDWLRARARRSAALFDGYRVDHLVGFYRTYSRPRVGAGEPAFSPADEPQQRTQGERVLGIFREPGAEIIAEDLGVVPDFVRRSLDALDVPGFKVFRWERQWHDEGQPFRDPADYPRVSVATSGTHDTEPLIQWWDEAPDEERAAMAAVPSVRAACGNADLANSPYCPVVRDALLETLFASGSDIVLFPVQDVFGWRDRINEPATVHESNWSYRLPWPVDTLDAQPDAVERGTALHAWAERHRRL